MPCLLKISIATLRIGHQAEDRHRTNDGEHSPPAPGVWQRAYLRHKPLLAGGCSVCAGFISAANAHTERELPLGLYSCAEKRISPLTSNSETLYLLE